MKYNYSLIIPHYNIPNLLQRLLRTVPNRSDLQIIVVDDCSSEETQTELEKIKIEFPQVEFYSTEVNGGGGKARNIGLAHALGKYVFFADADDYFDNALSDVLNKYQNTNFDIIYFTVKFFNQTQSIEIENNFVTNSIIKYKKYKNLRDLKFRFTHPWGKFINKNLIESNHIRFEESIISNDVKFSTLCDFYSKNFDVSLTCIYTWNIYNNSTSRTLSRDRIITRLIIDLERYKFLANIKWKSVNDSLWVLNLIYPLNDKDFEKYAYSLCQKYGVTFYEIIIHKLKWRIKKLIGYHTI